MNPSNLSPGELRQLYLSRRSEWLRGGSPELGERLGSFADCLGEALSLGAAHIHLRLARDSALRRASFRVEGELRAGGPWARGDEWIEPVWRMTGGQGREAGELFAAFRRCVFSCALGDQGEFPVEITGQTAPETGGGVTVVLSGLSRFDADAFRAFLESEELNRGVARAEEPSVARARL